MKTTQSNRSNLSALVVAAALLLPIVARGASTVRFDNQSGKPALVKLIGPTTSSVSVENDKMESVKVTAGHYFIKIRYGTPGNYSYSKGDEFDASETSTTSSDITITLHKVVAGNYGSKSISEAEFGRDEQSGSKTALTETNTLKLSERSAKILLEVVDEGTSSSLALLCSLIAKPEAPDNPTFQMLPLVGSRTNISIRDIIKKYGEPTIRTNIQSKPKNPTDKAVDYDLYNFDNGALLTCLKGSDDIQGLLEPQAWLIIGIRKKAQEALAERK